MTALIPNAALAYRVLDHINAHPEQHDQGTWWTTESACETAGCFAGWTVVLSGGVIARRDDFRPYVADGLGELNGQHPAIAAGELLGLDDVDDEDAAEWHPLFQGSNTREALGSHVAEIFGPRPEPTE